MTGVCNSTLPINSPLQVSSESSIPPVDAIYQSFNRDQSTCGFNLRGGEYATFLYTSVEITDTKVYYIYFNTTLLNDSSNQNVIAYYDNDNTSNTPLVYRVESNSIYASNNGNNNVSISKIYNGFSYNYSITFKSTNNQYFTSMIVSLEVDGPSFVSLPGSSSQPETIPNIIINTSLSSITNDIL